MFTRSGVLCIFSAFSFSLLLGRVFSPTVGADAEEVEEFKAAMKQRFDMSDLELLSFYLGIEVR